MRDARHLKDAVEAVVLEQFEADFNQFNVQPEQVAPGHVVRGAHGHNASAQHVITDVSQWQNASVSAQQVASQGQWHSASAQHVVTEDQWHDAQPSGSTGRHLGIASTNHSAQGIAHGITVGTGCPSEFTASENALMVKHVTGSTLVSEGVKYATRVASSMVASGYVASVTQASAKDASVVTPSTYLEAMSGPQRVQWEGAVAAEINSLAENDTWELVPRTPDMKVLTSKYVFKLKTDSEGVPVRYKARLVVGGHRQRYGIDFDETFAPVCKGATFT
jgi:hypothetical protein